MTWLTYYCYYFYFISTTTSSSITTTDYNNNNNNQTISLHTHTHTHTRTHTLYDIVPVFLHEFIDMCTVWCRAQTKFFLRFRTFQSNFYTFINKGLVRTCNRSVKVIAVFMLDVNNICKKKMKSKNKTFLQVLCFVFALRLFIGTWKKKFMINSHFLKAAAKTFCNRSMNLNYANGS